MTMTESISSPRIVAVLPARGGSKGIPGKNLMPLGGVSLLARTVRAARASRLVSEIYVSSDDDRILVEAEREGAIALRRPDDLATDTASSEVALLHAIDSIEAEGGSPVDIVVFLQCTSPFTSAADIDGTIGEMLEAEADCALAVSESHAFLWVPMAQGDHDAGTGLGPLGHDLDHRPRRQERPAQFVETGAVYVMRADGFRKARHRFFGKVVGHVTHERNTLEIDTPLDLTVARTICDAQQERSWADCLPSDIGALVFDFDGVMTDDHVYVTEDGVEMIRASRRDGMGIERVRKLGLPMAVISKETNVVVARRCEKLKIECFHGQEDKASLLSEWASERGIAPATIVFVGNDLNDVPVIPLVGAALAPSDAHPSFRDRASGILPCPGGEGAVRALCDVVAERLGVTRGNG